MGRERLGESHARRPGLLSPGPTRLHGGVYPGTAGRVDARVLTTALIQMRDQSSRMFFSRTTRPQRMSSSRSSMPNSWLEVGAGMAPEAISLLRTSGAASTAVAAALSLAT